MKYALIAATLATFAVTPAFAGGHGGARAGGLIGSVLAPVTTSVSALNVTALNGVGVLNGAGLLSGNSVNVLNGNRTSLTAPVVIRGLLGGNSYGCGCY